MGRLAIVYADLYEMSPRQRKTKPSPSRSGASAVCRCQAVPGSQEFPELFDGQSRIAHNASHSVSVHGIVSGNRKNPSAVAHDNVLSLVHDSEANLLKCSHCTEMVDSGNLRHDQTVTSTSRAWLPLASLSTASRYSRIAD